jgi:hypothetical protein
MVKTSKTVITADFSTSNKAKEGLIFPSYRILITITVYSLRINNLDIK